MIEKASTSLDRRILMLALPAIASNITVPLLGLCDTAITGHLGSGTFLAAVAAGGTVFNVILWICGFLRMATTGLTADALGSRAPGAVSLILWRSVSLATLIGLLILCFRSPLLSLFLGIISPGHDVAPLASLYFNICVWGIPPLLVTLSINGWFIGMQDTVRPMVISIFMNLLNVVGSILAVFPLGAGFKGVAIGTLCANWAGLLLALVLLRRFSRNKSVGRPRFRQLVGSSGFRRFFRVSGDLFLRSACIMGVSLAITSFGARMGLLTLAVNAVMLQFFIFFSYFMDGFSFAAEAICGRSAGAGDTSGLRRAVRRLLIWSAAMALIFFIIYLLSSSLIVSLLTDVPEVRRGVSTFNIFIILLPPVAVWAFIFDGFFIGLTATRRMFFTTLAAMTAFFAIICAAVPGLLFGVDPVTENRALWCAFLLFLLVRGLGLALQLPSIIRKRASLLKEKPQRKPAL